MNSDLLKVFIEKELVAGQVLALFLLGELRPLISFPKTPFPHGYDEEIKPYLMVFSVQ